MSRRKLVSYIRPEEPKFLRELKEQIKYKEGPTVDTKREALPRVSDDETEDLEGEKPVVVVLNSGDLTAEEVDKFEKQKQEEEAAAPADLSKRIIFSKNKLKNKSSNSAEEPVSKKVKRDKQKKAVLSFNDEDEENVG
ncbi:hypothetical protein KPH14_002362 [Odynerus spinipes]|uniref:DUF4604 domain-containing protein n=1 Tax=Odynerus spinipes TaxID=1348599 RepID=A0AAD9RLK5_9HYME|nr:hypothetical protein KPH14_002362 [Odynerus spinipes]